jgi:uncharacterized membrane protein YfcA
MPDWIGLLLSFGALFLGGVLKGATGIGAPIVAVPLLSALYSVPTAGIVFAVPNLLTNAWQAWQYRDSRPPAGLIWPFAVAGLLGTGLGTFLLVSMPEDVLLPVMAVAIFLFIGFRLARPDWALPIAIGRRLAAPACLLGGILFGSVGLSAPAAIPFLSAFRFARAVFVSTISVYFFALGLAQVPLLLASGVVTPWLALASLSAVVPLWLGMPVGAYLARFISARTFDRITLAILTVLGTRMLVVALF